MARLGDPIPYGLCIMVGFVLFPLVAFGGYIGTQSGTWREKATLMLVTLNAVVGVIVGGYIGAVAFYWLDLMIQFGIVPPWRELPSGLRDSGLWFVLVGLLGFIVGAIAAALCLCFWVVRTVQGHPERQDAWCPPTTPG